MFTRKQRTYSWALFGLLSFILLAYAVRFHSSLLFPLNKSIALSMHSAYSDCGQTLALLISAFAHKTTIHFMVAFIALVLCTKRQWHSALFFICSTYPILAYGRLLKTSLYSPRPELTQVSSKIFESPSYSFPSAHVVGFTATLLALLCLWAPQLAPKQRQRLYWASVLSVLTLCWARVYLTAHWLTDVAGALLLSISWVVTMAILMQPRPPQVRSIFFWGVLFAWFVAAGYHVQTRFTDERYAFFPLNSTPSTFALAADEV